MVVFMCCLRQLSRRRRLMIIYSYGSLMEYVSVAVEVVENC